MSTKKLTQDEFINRCNKLYDNYYDYSKVIYKNSRTKVIVICQKHGEFLVRADIHSRNRGCKMCGNNMLSQEEFVNISKSIHGNKYDYSKVNYINKRIKVKIICYTHGEFEQTPHHHLSNLGCSRCSGMRKKSEDIILEFETTHGDTYDYSLVDYKGAKSNVKIICKKHGIFEQSPESHRTKSGCPKCGNNTSISGNEWIESFDNKNIIVEKVLKIGGKRFKVDGFDPVNYVIYEFFGTFWHGHPDRKDLFGIHPYFKVPYSDLYQKTLDRVKYFEMFGYKVIYEWGR